MGCGSSLVSAPFGKGKASPDPSLRYVSGDKIERRCSYSECFEGTCKDTGTKVVLRNIPKAHGLFNRDVVLQELKELKDLNHKSCVRVLDVWEDDDAVHYAEEKSPSCADVLEFVAESSVHTDRQAALLLRSLLQGLAHIHAKGIVHRELLPKNILVIPGTDGADPSVAILNIGLHSLKAEVDLRSLRSGKAAGRPPFHWSPELAQAALDRQELTFSDRSDIWAVGVLAFTLLGGFPPFFSENATIMLQRISGADLQFLPAAHWSALPAPAVAFVRALLQKDPGARPSAKECLEMEWMQGLDDKASAGGAVELPIKIELKDAIAKLKARRALNVVQAVTRLGTEKKKKDGPDPFAVTEPASA
mmetsp:Transcript_5104/g.9765  ORF Transcript_5104/g.9765 Transcript_5104/m.9765 type:complete len:362 (+) Transcript_5104:319-1404(+)